MGDRSSLVAHTLMATITAACARLGERAPGAAGVDLQLDERAPLGDPATAQAPAEGHVLAGDHEPPAGPDAAGRGHAQLDRCVDAADLRAAGVAEADRAGGA